jgi:protein tyrosine phosphatase (PTP) superfamily phosphohydrolase (DUF442 family)
MTMKEICNYLSVSDTIGTAGQPTPQQFSAIKKAGYEVVINLAMPDSTNALPNERQLVTEQDMDYIHIPVVWEDPKLADLEQFFAAVNQHHNRKTFVHCALNWRVSSFILLYRVIHQNVALEVAQEMQSQIWEPDAVWQSFIERALAHHGINM